MDGESWKVTAASVQGTAHVRRNVPCQDAHGYRLLPNDLLLVVIADGAGSARAAGAGASQAVQQALARLETALEEDIPQSEPEWHDRLTAVFLAVRDHIVMLAQGQEEEPDKYATTLACAVAAPEFLVAAQIGDGAIVARDEEKGLFTAVQPQRGEYANETSFLTSKKMVDHLDIRYYPVPVQALVAMTDGLVDLALVRADSTPHPPFFLPLLSFNEQVADREDASRALTSFIASDRVCARTDDDKTLLLATRCDATPQVENKT